MIDLKLFLPSLLLVILGTTVLFSVSPNSFPEQFLHIGLALLVFLFFAKLDARVIKELAPWFYAFSLFLLLLTLIIGTVTKGSVRWIELGPFTIQPSEIVKPFLLVFFAWLVAKRKDELKKFILAILLFLPAAILILVQPDLGSTIVVAAGFFGVIFLAGLPLKLLLAAVASFLISSPVLWSFLAEYQKERIVSFLNPAADPLGAGYNSIQAMITVGSGGFSGRGLGQGSQSQLAFLPERHTDFIFASLSEELGFLASVLVISSFGFLLFRLIKILVATSDLYSRALLGGIFLTIFTQTAVNIGMNLGILPITGIPLPFVSAGGSSLVSMAAILGIASSLSGLKESRHSNILRQGGIL